MFSPLSSVGIFLVTLGILIILFPHLLQIIVAISLIFIGGSLLSIDRAVRHGKKVWIFPSRK